MLVQTMTFSDLEELPQDEAVTGLVTMNMNTNVPSFTIPESIMMKIADFGLLDEIQVFVLYRGKVGGVEIRGPEKFHQWVDFLNQNQGFGRDVPYLSFRGFDEGKSHFHVVYTRICESDSNICRCRRNHHIC